MQHIQVINHDVQLSNALVFIVVKLVGNYIYSKLEQLENV